MSGRFKYECPAPGCDGVMHGDFGDDVTCPQCGRTYTTDWDYTGADSMSAWIVGERPESADSEGRAQ